MQDKFYNANICQNTDRTAPKDKYGNVQGNEFDLARDGAFSGKTIAVLHLCAGKIFDFRLPKEALQQKGFGIIRWTNILPPLSEFKAVLSRSTQLWLISTCVQLLTEEYLTLITEFFNSGRGLFLWGDNDPYYQDANYVSKTLFNTTMSGDTMGDNIVPVQRWNTNVGIVPNHAITTGLEFLYEGITVATIAKTSDLKPLLYGSAGNLITAYYEKNGKRAIIDGGFTRLYVKWDTAGTARFVKNAAAWLANVERFDLVCNNTIETNQGNSIMDKWDKKPTSLQKKSPSLPDINSTLSKF